MVTAATYLKQPLFRSRARLDLLLSSFQRLTTEHGIAVQAWSIFPNHYHFVGVSNGPARIRPFPQHFHPVTAREINALDDTPGRMVWFQFWDSRVTYQKSYFSRLRYVHENPVRHGITRLAANYPWCSASWFERKASPAFRKTVFSFPCDKLNVPDEFEVSAAEIEDEVVRPQAALECESLLSLCLLIQGRLVREESDAADS